MALPGIAAFENVPRGPDMRERLWLPHDGHWGQGGSDLFARYFFEQFRDCHPLAEEQTPAAADDSANTTAPSAQP
jgi:hypothetical protein